MDTERRLYRPSSDRMIGGVASGFARYFGIDIAIARIVWGVLLFAGVGLPLYLLCWIAIPRDPEIVIDGFTIRTEPKRSLFGTLFRIALLLGVGAIVISEFDRDVAIIAFLVGLGFGLYHLWRNRAQDDDGDDVTSALANGSRTLYRSETNRRILGVFGGLGEVFGVDPMLLRIVGGIVLIAGFPVIIPLYLLYAVVVPSRRVIAL